MERYQLYDISVNDSFSDIKISMRSLDKSLGSTLLVGGLNIKEVHVEETWQPRLTIFNVG